MDYEDYHKSRILEIAAQAKSLQEEWAGKSSENKTLVEKKLSMEISGGRYREMGWVKGHPDYSSSTCARCKAKDFYHHRVEAGCRHNGDGYGTFVSVCKTCGFLSWESYDEA